MGLIFKRIECGIVKKRKNVTTPYIQYFSILFLIFKYQILIVPKKLFNIQNIYSLTQKLISCNPLKI